MNAGVTPDALSSGPRGPLLAFTVAISPNTQIKMQVPPALNP